jgi:hypothetical protein
MEQAPINPVPLKTRFRGFIRLTTPGLKPLFGRLVFYARVGAFLFSFLSFCAMARLVRPCEL